MTTPTPPGWYADPDDSAQQRWWDGNRWTEFTTAWGSSTAEQAAASAATPTPTPQTRATARQRPRSWRPTPVTWIVGGAALLAAVVGAAAGGIGGLLITLALFGIAAGAWTLGTRKPSFLNLPPARRVAGSVLGISLGVLVIGAVVAPRPAGPADLADSAGMGTSIRIDSTPPSAEQRPSPTPSPTPTPVMTTQIVEVPEAIGFAQTSVEDPNLDVGTSTLVTGGVPGTKVSRWEITLVDGVETGRVLVSEAVTVTPVDEVIAIGTRQPAPPPPAEPPAGGGCHPNYAGACVPIDTDVDCAGGSGNGPSYVAGPVQVVGPDVYDLDRDGDGIACD